MGIQSETIDELGWRVIILKRLLREALEVLEEYDRCAELIERVKSESSVLDRKHDAPWWEKQE